MIKTLKIAGMIVGGLLIVRGLAATIEETLYEAQERRVKRHEARFDQDFSHQQEQERANAIRRVNQ